MLVGRTHRAITKNQRLKLTAVYQLILVESKVSGCRCSLDLPDLVVHKYDATFALPIKHKPQVVSSLIERKEETASPIVSSGFSFTARKV